MKNNTFLATVMTAVVLFSSASSADLRPRERSPISHCEALLNDESIYGYMDFSSLFDLEISYPYSMARNLLVLAQEIGGVLRNTSINLSFIKELGPNQGYTLNLKTEYANAYFWKSTLAQLSPVVNGLVFEARRSGYFEDAEVREKIKTAYLGAAQALDELTSFPAEYERPMGYEDVYLPQIEKLRKTIADCIAEVESYPSAAPNTSTHECNPLKPELLRDVEYVRTMMQEKAGPTGVSAFPWWSR